MARQPILQNGAEVLRQHAEPLPAELFGSEKLKTMIADMVDSLDAEADGVAIAAPQIGLPYRMFVVRYDRTITVSESVENKDTQSLAPDIGVFINPEFVKTSRRRVEMDEGCLSVRGIYGTTLRHERATVRAVGADGVPFERGGGGLLAQIFQHEIDHLNGVLFIDHAHELVDKTQPEPISVETTTKESFVFFGTPYVASDTLEILHEHGYIPALVVTSPDAPRGRGLTLTPSETKEWALAHDIPVIAPEKLTAEVLETIHSYNSTFGIAVAYGKILPQKFIDSFPLGILNVHYSLLPKYRGASPVEAALLNNEKTTGVSIQQMVHALDAGDVLATLEVPIAPTETTRELRPRLVALGANLLVQTLPTFIAGTVSPTPQNSAEASHCSKISKEDGLLDLSGDAQTNWNKYRAYAESPGTYFFVTKNGKQMRVKIKTAVFENGRFTPDRIIPEGKSEQSFADFSKTLS